MKVLFVGLLVVLLGLVAVQGADVCRFGERWRCGSIDCEKTCANIKSNTVCTTTCSNGCFCEAGFVRTAFGNCEPWFVCRYKTMTRL